MVCVNETSKMGSGRRIAAACCAVALGAAVCLGMTGCAAPAGSSASSSAGFSASDVAPVTESSASSAADAAQGAISVEMTLTESVVGADIQETALQFAEEQQTVSVDEGATVLDALEAMGRELKTQGSGDAEAVVAIGGLENGAAGVDSHWEYSVNGAVQTISPAEYPLNDGDTVTFTTKLGTRTYAVTGVAKVSVNDVSGLEPTSVNMVTLYTCVNDQPAYRWCVTAREV